MDTLLTTQPANAGVSAILVLAVWAAAIIAAVAATLERAKGTRELREQVQELERRSVQPAEPVRAASSRATPSFGATFYESGPTLFDRLLSWPGAAPTLLAAVLALAGTGLLVANNRNRVGDAVSYQRQLSGLQAAHDSLAMMVKDLRDSLRVVADAPAPTAGRKVTAAPTERVKPLATAMGGVAPKTVAIPKAPTSQGVIPAAPALDAGVIPPSPKAPVLP